MQQEVPECPSLLVDPDLSLPYFLLCCFSMVLAKATCRYFCSCLCSQRNFVYSLVHQASVQCFGMQQYHWKMPCCCEFCFCCCCCCFWCCWCYVCRCTSDQTQSIATRTECNYRIDCLRAQLDVWLTQCHAVMSGLHTSNSAALT